MDEDFDFLIRKYALKEVDDYDYDEINENKYVKSITRHGTSGRYPDKLWFTAWGEDDDFDFYMKREVKNSDGSQD